MIRTDPESGQDVLLPDPTEPLQSVSHLSQDGVWKTVARRMGGLAYDIGVLQVVDPNRIQTTDGTITHNPDGSITFSGADDNRTTVIPQGKATVNGRQRYVSPHAVKVS